MATQVIVSPPRRARTDPETWGQRSLRLSRELSAQLSDEEFFDNASKHLARLVERSGCVAVAGASETGGILAQAIARTLGIEVWQPPAALKGRLALVDGMVNTGMQLVAAIEKAREWGAPDAVGIGLRGQREAVTTWKASGYELSLVEEL